MSTKSQSPFVVQSSASESNNRQSITKSTVHPVSL